MKSLSILLFVFMVSMTSCTIQEKKTVQEKEISKESESSPLQPAPLDDPWFNGLVGQWNIVSGESSLTDKSGNVAKIDVDEMGEGGFEIELGLNCSVEKLFKK